MGVAIGLTLRGSLLLAGVWIICAFGALLIGPLIHTPELTFAAGPFGTGDIFSHDLQRGITLNLTAHYGPSSGKPLWSPDGQRLAFVAQHDDTYHVIVMNAAGGELRDLVPLINGEIQLAWSPDSQSLALSVLRRVYVFAVSGDVYFELPIAGALVGWSAQGQVLFKMLDRLGEVRAFNPADETLAPILDDARLKLMPQVAPDGTQLAYLAENSDGQRGLYVTALGAHQPQPITTSYQVLEILSWSPDGRALAFSAYTADRQNEVYWVDVADGRVQQLTANRATESALAWSPEGGYLSYVIRNQQQSNLYLLDLSSGKQHFLLSAVGAYDSLSWRP